MQSFVAQTRMNSVSFSAGLQVIACHTIQNNRRHISESNEKPKEKEVCKAGPIQNEISRGVDAAEQGRKEHQPEARQNDRLWPPLECLTKQKCLSIDALDWIQSRRCPNRSATTVTK